MNIRETIIKKISTALRSLKLEEGTSFTLERPPQSILGDYSANVAMVVAKTIKSSPRELAQKLQEGIVKKDKGKTFEKVEVAGPGFLNFFLSKDILQENLQEVLKQKEKYGSSKQGKGEKVLVEYFQPNIAKPLHLGHLRTAIIGDSLFRLLKFSGFEVSSDTHIGDWGTQFGLLLAAYKKYGDDKVIDKDPIEELNKLYVRINKEIESNPQVRELGKQEFVMLEKGDKQNRRLLEKFVDWSQEEFEKSYEILNIRKHDHNWPESFYEDKMPAVLEELRKKKFLRESEGAQVVDLSEHNLGVAIIIKSDGGTTYLLRDLATFIYRKKQGFEKQLYVVDNRQKHALAQTFKVLELLGHIKSPDEAVHIDYGFLRLPEGAMSSRKGNFITPQDLINEVVSRVTKIIQRKNPELADKEKVAKQVGLGAIKYFDLSHNLKTDLVFRWDEVLNFEGNTGPYLQYSHARIKSIMRKSGSIKQSFKVSELASEERQLLAALSVFPDAVSRAAELYTPNMLADYLYRLAGTFNLFYQKVSVLKEREEVKRNFRISLVTAVAQVLKNGLLLLGVDAPEEM